MCPNARKMVYDLYFSMNAIHEKGVKRREWKFAIICLFLFTPASGNLKSGLIAWYPFDSNASDMSGNGNHGTVYGASASADRFGQGNQAYFSMGSMIILIWEIPPL